MAYARADLHRIGGAIPGLSIYKTADPILTVVGSGYFNDATNELYQGDVIIVSDTNAGTVDLISVTSADQAATVTTVNGT